MEERGDRKGSERSNRPGTEKPPEAPARMQAPSIRVPKGGGAIRGIGEKFAANPVTGTGSMSVPVAMSPGRAGFGPQLSLSYDSGSGNGPFGFGWSLSVPSISRKTDKRLPVYRDAEEADVFVLSGAEDLVPVLGSNGKRLVDTTTAPGFAIQRYRPRIEGLFARIERWTDLANGDIHWRSISRDNVTTVYGTDGDSRVFDPADPEPQHPRRIFTWLLHETYDDKGNVALYEYSKEDDAGIDKAQAHERNRTRTANRYLKRVRYGNRTSRLLEPDVTKQTWLFELVFDYDEGHYEELPLDPNHPEAEQHRLVRASASLARAWTVRPDSFSSYRAGFEARTYRRCRRILMFHLFPELGAEPCLVRSTEIDYADLGTTKPITLDVELGHQGSTRFASFIRSITHSGFVRDEKRPVVDIGGVRYVTYLKKSLPPVEFEYSKAIVQGEVREIDARSLENLPIGLDGTAYQWADLDGEGVSGILTEQAGTWFYKPNLGDASFGAIRALPTRPSPPGLATGDQQLLDLSGDGQLDVVSFDSPAPGFFERTLDERWTPFRAFRQVPNVQLNAPNVRFIDLDGDGHADILVSEHDVFTFYPSLAEEGFGPARQVRLPADEERGPRLVLADAVQSIYLADMSGDGLTDLVRIRNGEVCYWPNLGHGRFGPKVSMDEAPWFDRPDQFDQRRVRLADIDGSGTTDIVYVGCDGVRLYFNQCGNRWSKARRLPPLPHLSDPATVTTVDLLGNGTACLVWSSPLPADARRPLRYIDLMGGQKPHLLTRTVNNLGAETRVEYAPSTRFYLADKCAGKPWITRVPFPVHVIARVETHDRVSRNRFVTRYAYHHGYFDGEEREFRGFGLVEQWDTEDLAALTTSGAFPTAANIDASSHVPPVLTRSWFHTGVHLGRDRISRFFAGLAGTGDTGEYYRAPGTTDVEAEELLLPDTVLPPGLTADEERQACRALKGSLLRQEVYSLDGTAKEKHPYAITEQNFTIEVVQGRGANLQAVFFTHARESIRYHHDRALFPVLAGQIVDDATAASNPAVEWLPDPRVAHTLTLEVDEFGNVLRSAAVAYGRRFADSRLPRQTDRDEQARTWITYTENGVTDAVDTSSAYRARLPCESRTYELTGVALPAKKRRLSFQDVSDAGLAALAIDYEKTPNAAVTTKRLIEHVRTLYRRDDLTGALPLRQLGSLALPFESYKLALTAGLVSDVYQGRVTNAMLQDHGRYVHSEGDAQWWVPSGQIFYSPGPADTPAAELAHARASFFLPCRYRDPFHSPLASTETTITYDVHRLLLQETRDPLDNRVTVGQRDVDPTKPLVAPGQDYRVLQPALVMDANRNRVAVTFDALGLVAGTAVMGKPEDAPAVGDRLTPAFRADPTQAEMDQLFANPAGPAAIALLGDATTRVVYDVLAHFREPYSAKKPPASCVTLARESHVSDPVLPGGLRIQRTFAYSDGFGREIQKKVQAEPGPVPARDAAGNILLGANGQPQMTAGDTSPRWVGTGWIVFNNKGDPVRKYEPFFTDTHRFELDVRIGVSPVLLYDPVARLVATLMPDHTWSKVVFDPWRQETWDVGDTVLIANPTGDPDVGALFGRLRQADYLPTWHAQRQGGALGPQEQAAARKAAVHAATPAVAHGDSLGRAFLTVVHNRFKYSNTPPAAPPVEERHETRVVRDIEGNTREVVDAKDRRAVRYWYDMLGNGARQSSMEAGQRWMLGDVAGKALYAWDDLNHRFRTTYDRLRRPTGTLLTVGADPAEKLVERAVYGESLLAPEAKNQRCKVVQRFDQAGVVTSDEYDFKGNLLRGERQLAREYKAVLDWVTAEPLETETYGTSTKYDALNRPVTLTTHDRSVVRSTYNEAGLLERVDVNLRGAQQNGNPVWTPFVTDIDYDAKGQRILMAYGPDGLQTTYERDPLTFRLVHLVTRRKPAVFPGDCPEPPPAGWPGCRIQNLRYTYDAAGNITHIRDFAQQTVYFGNTRVEPSAEYTYDATHRLIEATGREHLGQVGGAPIPHSYNDAPRARRAHPNDGNAMGLYLERYVYDAVGNILSMQHRGLGPGNPGWTRAYTYQEPSQLEAGKYNNRLTSTTIGAVTEAYSTAGGGYDAHGNMLRMPHLQVMQWDFRNHLQMTQRQSVNASDTDGVARHGERTYHVYDSAGQRVRKVIERPNGQVKEERVYLGTFEFYRRSGPSPLVRETLHVMDDQRRIALVETRTQGAEPGVPAQLTRFQLGNHLGSANLELDGQAQIISYEEYTPYGSTSYQGVRSQTEAPKRYRCTGKERDEESGLYYHGARHCAPWLGRWTSCDPAGMVDGTNLYVYVKSSPTGSWDPTGRQEEPLVSTKDPNDPRNYVSFEHYREGAVGPLSEQGLRDAWNQAHPQPPPQPPKPAAAPAPPPEPEKKESDVVLPPLSEEEREARDERFREKTPWLSFFVRVPMPYVRPYQPLPADAPYGLAAIRQLNGQPAVAVANFSRDIAPGTSIENLTLLSVTALSAGVNAVSAAGRLGLFPAVTRVSAASGTSENAVRVGSESIEIFRTVGEGERVAIEAGGRYAAPVGGVEGKYFYPTVQQATNLARQNFPSQGVQTLTSVRVPNSALQGATRLNVAGEGAVIFFSAERLPPLPAPRVWPYFPIFPGQ